MRYNYDTKDFQVAHKLNNEILTFDDYKDQFHIVYEFLLFIEGDLEYVVENKKYKLEPYDLLLIKPGQHYYINFYSTGKYERCVITFDKSLVPLHIANSFNNKEQKLQIKDTPLIEIFNRFDIYRQTFDGEDLYEVSRGLLTELIIYFNKYASDLIEDSPNRFVNPIIHNILDYISLNIDKDLSISNISKHFNVSSSYLCNAFKESMQTSISKYIRSKRIILAHSYILRGEKPTEVYEKCGFIDYSTFYRSYQKVMGFPPSKKVELF